MSEPKVPLYSYVGGKFGLKDAIIKLIPPHKIYIEPFFGGGSVFFAKEKSKIELINDISNNIINLWLVIKNNHKELEFELSKLISSRHLFNQIKNGGIVPENNIQKAAYYFYLKKHSWGGICAAYQGGSLDKVAQISLSLDKYAERIKNVKIENQSYINIIKYNNKKEVFFYFDPPYLGAEHYYGRSFNHDELLDHIKTIKGYFLLSYNNSPYIKNLYKDFYIKEIEAKYFLGTKSGTPRKAAEVLISNYDLKEMEQKLAFS